MRPRRYSIRPSAWSLPAASVTPSRRTPSMLAISSWVISTSLEASRSSLSSSQRQSCFYRMMFASLIYNFIVIYPSLHYPLSLLIHQNFIISLLHFLNPLLFLYYFPYFAS
jgi:hypothetical protein